MATESGHALVLGTSPFGEADVLLHLLCPCRGRLKGLVRGGAKKGAVLQPFNTVAYERFRRLETQLGTLEVDLLLSRAPLWMHGGAGARTCAYLTEMLTVFLPEEQAFPQLEAEALGLLQRAATAEGTWQDMLAFELFLLETLGYGLRLEDPVQADRTDEPAYVSPRSGRSVGRRAAQGYEDRLLPLPGCLGGPTTLPEQDAAAALALTGTFLGRALPPGKDPGSLLARARLAAYHRGMLSPATTKGSLHAPHLSPCAA